MLSTKYQPFYSGCIVYTDSYYQQNCFEDLDSIIVWNFFIFWGNMPQKVIWHFLSMAEP